MYYELYIDVYFLINLVMDYLILLIVRKLLKCTATHLRILSGSLLGAVLACLAVLVPPGFYKAAAIISFIGIPMLMVRIGLGYRWGKPAVKGLLSFYAVSFLTGGVFEWLNEYLTNRAGFRTFLFLSAASYGIIRAGMEIYRYFYQKNGHIYPVTLSWRGKLLNISGLLDTGNSLLDPVSHRPVCIIGYEAISALMTEEIRNGWKQMIRMETEVAATGQPQGEALYYIPYHAVGKTNGLLPGCSIDYLVIDLDGQKKVVRHPVIGISREPVSSGNRYQMILHPQLLSG